MEEKETAAPVMTVLGEISGADLGVTLVHEHLFNDMSGALAPPSFDYSSFLPSAPVSASALWALREDPYCSPDNVAPRTFEDALSEVEGFLEVGGTTIVDATGSAAIGRDPDLLRRVALATGANVVMSTGPYLESIEKSRVADADAEQLTGAMLDDLWVGVGEHQVRAGVIGEIGVSPLFTDHERKSLRAACIAQREHGKVGMNIHMPGWLRRGHEILDLVLDEQGVDPSRVSLAHADPSGADTDYQRSLLDRGVWLEFDMIGLDISFPGEGPSPSARETASHVAALIEAGYGDQILLSHDLFLKQMLTAYGGNGLRYVPTVFLSMLEALGVESEIRYILLTDNPRRFLTGS